MYSSFLSSLQLWEVPKTICKANVNPLFPTCSDPLEGNLMALTCQSLEYGAAQWLEKRGKDSDAN
ncbi:hypothetical protein C0J52_00670 [Blattella germanica]|nr:hypothetical protein C0J52_00670 [Blattella germanica]